MFEKLSNGSVELKNSNAAISNFVFFFDHPTRPSSPNLKSHPTILHLNKQRPGHVSLTQRMSPTASFSETQRTSDQHRALLSRFLLYRKTLIGPPNLPITTTFYVAPLRPTTTHSSTNFSIVCANVSPPRNPRSLSTNLSAVFADGKKPPVQVPPDVILDITSLFFLLPHTLQKNIYPPKKANFYLSIYQCSTSVQEQAIASNAGTK